jgi:hypothetical protein
MHSQAAASCPHRKNTQQECEVSVASLARYGLRDRIAQRQHRSVRGLQMQRRMDHTSGNENAREHVPHLASASDCDYAAPSLYFDPSQVMPSYCEQEMFPAERNLEMRVEDKNQALSSPDHRPEPHPQFRPP